MYGMLCGALQLCLCTLLDPLWHVIIEVCSWNVFICGHMFSLA